MDIKLTIIKYLWHIKENLEDMATSRDIEIDSVIIDLSIIIEGLTKGNH